MVHIVRHTVGRFLYYVNATAVLVFALSNTKMLKNVLSISVCWYKYRIMKTCRASLSNVPKLNQTNVLK